MIQDSKTAKQNRLKETSTCRVIKMVKIKDKDKLLNAAK